MVELDQELELTECSGTTHYTTAEVKSNLGGAWSSLIRERIETYGVGKFEVNAETVRELLAFNDIGPKPEPELIVQARKGMSLVLHQLRNRQPLPDTAEFYPPPPPNFGETWPTEAKRDDAPASFFLSPSSVANMDRDRRE